MATQSTHDGGEARYGRRLSIGALLRVISLGVSTVLALVLTPFVVHTLGDRSYGIWSLVTAITSYYALLDIGLSGAVTRHLSGAIGKNDGEDCNRIISTALATYQLLGVFVFMLSMGVAASAGIILHNSVELGTFRRVVLIVGTGTAVTIPMRALFGILIAHLRFDYTASIEITVTVLRALATWLSLRSGATVLALAWINCGCVVLSLMLSWWASRKVAPTVHIGIRYAGLDTARQLMSYGMISMVAQLADMLRFQADVLVVGAFVGVAAITHYNIAGSLAQYFISFMLAASGTLGPLFSRLHGSGDRQIVINVFEIGTKVTVALAILTGFCIIALGRAFIERWMGAAYLDAYPVTCVLVIGAVAALAQIPSLQLLYGISRHGLFAVFNSVEGVANLILSIILVRHYGMIGVALGTMIPMVVVKLCVQPAYVCRIANIKLSHYYLLVSCTVGASLLALVIPALLIAWFVRPDFKIIMILALVSAACFVPVSARILLNKSERKYVTARIRKWADRERVMLKPTLEV